MATGSPTSTLSLNLMPFVVRPSFTSRQTMTLFSSMGCRPRLHAGPRAVPRKEIAQQLQPEWPGLFHVALECNQVVPGDAGGEVHAVIGLGSDHLPVDRIGIVGVHEIERRVLRDAGKHGVGFREV